MSAVVVACLTGTCLLHLAYFRALQKGYRVGDLSVVYPMARGTGPLLSFVGALVILGERPSWVTAAGALLVILGVFTLAGAPRTGALRLRAGLLWGALTGVFIAFYTINDGYAIKVLGLSPFVVEYVGSTFRTLVLAPNAWRDRRRAIDEYRRHWFDALGVSVLGPMSYVLILYAMQLAPVSKVAPARELSMMVGAYLGTRILNEGQAHRRLLASVFIVAGVIALGWG